jgi:hypothetical protein
MSNPFKRKYIHETTGDVLTFSEQISWKVQGIIRNWYFVILWSTVTFVWWCQPTWFTDTHAYIKWMNLASWLAVTVELVIGIAMIGQTKRDAQIIRAMYKMLPEIQQALEYIRKLEEREIDMIGELHE